MSHVLLASQSPRRRTLLEQTGVSVTVVASRFDETARADEDALAYARRVAAGKLANARMQHGASAGWWLAADTVVWLAQGRRPLGKPRTREAAAAMLDQLTGAEPHFVTTAWAIARGTDSAEVFAETTRVFMRRLRASERSAYLAGDAWRDKAGGYGIQAEAAGWVTRIEGSYTNVVGLPLAQVLAYVEEDPR